MSLFDAQAPRLPIDGRTDQFRLARMQTFNWGTFDKLHDFDIPAEGYLFVGPSGSGKSTVLDAHAALITPPKWLHFNVAARENERGGKDRNAMTYVRGAWSQQTVSGEAVAQYLRPDTTWSAIAATYRNTDGRIVTLAQVLWVRGKTTGNTPNDLKRMYLVLDREFELSELQFFPGSDFDSRLFKRELPDAYTATDFRPYQDRFMDRLGIENERALRLLHKTQSAKNLGELNEFLREYMLDAPATFEVADRLVNEFAELNLAHQAVVTARLQIETLRPAQESWMERQRLDNERQVLGEISAGIDLFTREKRMALTAEELRIAIKERDFHEQAHQNLEQATQRELAQLTHLRNQQHEMGGATLQRLENEIDKANKEKPERLRKRDSAQAACRVMGWTMPDNLVAFIGRTTEAGQFIEHADDRASKIQERRDAIKLELHQVQTQLVETAKELESMRERKSNISGRLLRVREEMSRDLGIAEEALPFVGELLEVRSEESDWQGAIEAVLGAFSNSILVEDRHYAAVSGWLDSHDTGERVFYNRMIPQPAANRTLSAQSLVRKLNIAQAASARWLREELTARFHDFDCAEDLQAFRAAHRAVTKQGQIKRDTSRHEKNDLRGGVRNRSGWVLGFDNAAKLRIFEDRAAELDAAHRKLQDSLRTIEQDGSDQRAKEVACNKLQNLSWNDVDVASLATLVSTLEQQLVEERERLPGLAAMEFQVSRQQSVYDKAYQAQVKTAGELSLARQASNRLRAELDRLERLQVNVPLTPTQRGALETRMSRIISNRTDAFLDLSSLDSIMNGVERSLTNEKNDLTQRMADLKAHIERCFHVFKERWKVEAASLDETMASAEDYFAKLARLIADGLPEHEKNFMRLLSEQSDQNLAQLITKLELERNQIRERMEIVNESLQAAPFDRDATGQFETRLDIETKDRNLQEVIDFKRSLKEAHSLSLGSTDQDAAEARFAKLEEVVKRLGSKEAADLNWKARVLDVRQHVDFIAHERDALTTQEVNVYTSGAGKSGGQRQKLTATCLAAALRYQLGGQDRHALPAFSTIMLDEAFDKADSDFTALAANIFKEFSFQLVIATPLKSVMTLEPFIGGACYVSIKDRMNSSALRITYDGDSRRLQLDDERIHAAESAVA